MTEHVGDYTEQVPTMYVQGLFEQSPTKKHKLGTIRELDDGRKFVYCLSTVAAIAAAVLVSKAVTKQACTVVAADIAKVGDKKVTVTLSGTPTLNQYQDGWLVVTAGPGAGEMYKIRGNTVDDVPAVGRVTIYLYDSINTLWTASTTIDIFESPYSGVLLNPAVTASTGTEMERALGVTTRIITAAAVAKYFWAQTKGLCSLLMNGSSSGDEADEVEVIAGTTAGYGLTVTIRPMEGHIGQLMVGADVDDTEASLIDLQL